MAERPAVNASPLILLARAGALDLLRVVGAELVVPREVAHEVSPPESPQSLADVLAATPWLHVMEAPAPSPFVAARNLGRGETAVLAWGEAHPNTELVLDDLAARRCAAALGIPVRGTIGIVLAAKTRGIVPAAGPILAALRGNGMYASDALIEAALRMVGE